MKIAIACKSMLLKKSLEIFLKDNITSYKSCDFAISDQFITIDKPLMVVGHIEEADIKIPFSKAVILMETERFYKKIKDKKASIQVGQSFVKTVDFSFVERKIDDAIDKFRSEIINIVKEHYEAK